MSRKNKKGKSKAPKVILVLIILLIAAAGGIYFLGGFGGVNLDKELTFTVPEGSSAKQISAILADNELIANKTSFELYVRFRGVASELKPGEFTIGPGKIKYADIVDLLIDGNVMANTVTITIPEGRSVYEVAEILDEKNVVTLDEFLSTASSIDVAYDYIPDGNDYQRLEGFLYPETYNIGKTWNSEQIIKMMLAEFDKNWTDERQAEADKLGLTVNQVVTVASLIEEEAQIEEERPVIASVIYNRLEDDMLLQIDATVQYALGAHKSVVTYADLEIESPYNTYKYKGLPPGPISAPGISCIDAALNPQDTTYLFYQTTVEGDGSHYFCNTYEEHMQYNALKK